MKKVSRITRISLMIAIFFALDKGLGIIRQLIIGRQFGLSEELDVFNAANNLPDMLFALISGGALAIAFIPVLSEVLTKDGKSQAWRLFSSIANLAFIVTFSFSIVIALLAGPLVRSQLGIAPGFNAEQQSLAVDLMRLNLISTLIFSISGLVMAGLQANQHFLFPALAPLLYDIGQIFGAVILAPEKGLNIGGLTLPAFGLGVKGLVYGVILGALLHLIIQIPGLIKYRFKWSMEIKLRDANVIKVLKLMGPRLVSMVFIQLIFLVQDNLASRLSVGAISALTYGWLIMQVPETLIGTAIATALLPTLSEMVVREEVAELREKIVRTIKVMIALSVPISAILAAGLLPLIQLAFGFSTTETQLVMRTTQAFLLGVAGHSLVELAVRAFYARQNAKVPMIAAASTFGVYLPLAIGLMLLLGAPGIALANSIVFSLQAIVLIVLLGHNLQGKLSPGCTIVSSLISGFIGALVVWLSLNTIPIELSPWIVASIGMLLGAGMAAIPIHRELKQLLKL